MQDFDELRSFYLPEVLGERNLFDVWEQGDAWGDSVTPATYSGAYRAWLLSQIRSRLRGRQRPRVLSVGCGNAFVERELQRDGYLVLAVDVLPEAVALARQKGVNAVVADAATWEPPAGGWDMVYADGLLGHMYDAGAGCAPVLRHFCGWLQPRDGLLVVSNDAPTRGNAATPANGVPGFHWLSASLLADEIRAAGFALSSADEFVYQRPLSGPRRRAVLTARPATR
jgi:SAM-dependent methyltransferase